MIFHSFLKATKRKSADFLQLYFSPKFLFICDEVMEEFTFDEVRRRNEEPGACWLIIHGQAYEVTAFLDDHPGGRERLLAARGRDATHDFNAARHPRRVREQIMPRYYRRDVDMSTVPGDRNQDPKPHKVIRGDPTPRIRISQLLLILALAAYFGLFPQALVILVIAVACRYLIIQN